MDVRVDRDPFLSVLSSAAAIADRKSAQSVLANVLLRADGPATINVAATNLIMTVTAALDAKVKSGGSCTVPARALHSFVKTLIDDSVRLTIKDNASTLIVRCGKSTCELPVLAPNDFPKLPDHAGLTMAEVSSVILRELLSKTSYAVATDNSRPHLRGIHLVIKNGKAKAEASDGHRAAQISRDMPNGAIDSVMIPPAAVTEIQRLIANADKVGIAEQGGHFFVSSEGTIIAVKTVGATFPDLESLLPKRVDSGTADRNSLLSAFRRVALFTDPAAANTNEKPVSSGGGVKVTMGKDRIMLAAQHASARAEDEVSVEYVGAEFEFGLNARYVTEALESIGDPKVAFQIDAELAHPISFWPFGDGAQRVVVLKMGL